MKHHFQDLNINVFELAFIIILINDLQYEVCTCVTGQACFEPLFVHKMYHKKLDFFK